LCGFKAAIEKGVELLFNSPTSQMAKKPIYCFYTLNSGCGGKLLEMLTSVEERFVVEGDEKLKPL
jgi:hypothetical protein